MPHITTSGTQIFGRAELKVNTATQSAILEAYNNYAGAITC